ncbi:hypothetical protein [Dethiosulfovibrio salsuginis]|uniref:Uncharacterized protein n=1 Tax=Dethiosulfovibrio salsuginis TaxID=561720 RepID=A0A1X7KW26_9BACT|nr:hypothetical protein [Dethiosulfovibrio salsuginis]SMG45759.1 hypothetical protein SAMN06275492_13813 [Dethiosulfovibrio salsuginis]
MSECTEQYPVIRPGKPILFETYRFRGRAGCLIPKEGRFCATRDVVIQWVKDKLDQVPLPEALSQGEEFSLDFYGQIAEGVNLPERKLWTVRMTQPDVGLPGHIDPVPGCSWISDLSVMEIDGQVEFGVKITCSYLPDRKALPGFIRPGIIRRLAHLVGLSQIRPVDGKVWDLLSPEDLNDLEGFLCSKERYLPVVVISQTDGPDPSSEQSYLVDGDHLAKDLIGYAHVVRMNWDLSLLWTDMVGVPWTVSNGGVRIYRPGLDFDADQYQSHPLMDKDRIRRWMGSADRRDNGYVQYLSDFLKSFPARTSLSWGGLVFVPEARLIAREERAKAPMEDQVARNEALEDQIEALKLLLEATRSDRDEYLAMAESALRETDSYKEELFSLRNSYITLQAMWESRTGQSVDDELILPDSYNHMAQWVSDHFTGRLKLHPRAVRALKDGAYEKPQLVAQALMALAKEYRDVKLGLQDYSVFQERLQEIGLDCRPSISNESAGKYDDRYFIPISQNGRDRTLLLDNHLCKGVSKDRSLCLRIYFLWDNSRDEVVVGWLPSHLPNSKS